MGYQIKALMSPNILGVCPSGRCPAPQPGTSIMIRKMRWLVSVRIETSDFGSEPKILEFKLSTNWAGNEYRMKNDRGQLRTLIHSRPVTKICPKTGSSKRELFHRREIGTQPSY